MGVKKLCLQSFEEVIKAALPAHCIKDFIPAPPKGRLIVIGAGKASAAMATAFEDNYDGAIEGLVITRYGHNVPTKHIKILEAAHPVPDKNGQKAVAEMIALLKTTNENDLVVCLISGGGSSLLSSPVEDVEFSVLQKLQRDLLGSGADITEMNIVRKHLNVALGGGLAKAASPARMITLSISDVVGDDPQIIASGASTYDESTLDNAKDILTRYNINCPQSIEDALNNSANETPNANDSVFERNEYHLIATPIQSLEAARAFWNSQGFDAYIWNAEIEGDTNKAAENHIAYITNLMENPGDVKFPCAIITGGETTIKLGENHGKGGPNSHFMLKTALLLNGNPRIYAMACDTDGIDGAGDHAGAFISPDTIGKAQNLNLKLEDSLAAQNSYAAFETLGDLVITGPSFTNVNDYRVFIIMP